MNAQASTIATESGQAALVADRARRLPVFMAAIGIPEKFVARTWEDFTPLEGKVAALAAARRYAAGQAAKRGLVLNGPTGAGKTLLAYLILRQAFLDGVDPSNSAEDCLFGRYPVFWAPMGQWFRRVQVRCFDDHTSTVEEEVRKLQHPELLVLDDVGTKGFGEWVQETLLEVLDHRIDRERAMVMTTNYEAGALPEVLGERIASRVLGFCDVIEVLGKDMRLTR